MSDHLSPDGNEGDQCSFSSDPNYIRFFDVLSASSNTLLLDYALDRVPYFTAAQVVDGGSAGVDTEIRSTKILTDLSDLPRSIVDSLLRRKEEAFRFLGASSPDQADVSFQILFYGHGDYFGIHQDRSHEYGESRQVSFVYFFSETPQSFSGGELRVFSRWFPEIESFHDITPTNNSLIYFNSVTYHEVRRVEFLPGRSNGGRFALVGWLGKGVS